MMIKSENLVFEYIRRDESNNVISILKAVDNVNLKVAEGQFIAILGHNGSGKSTLAKHLNAILSPTEGSLWVNGYDTKNDDHIDNIRRSTGMVFQNPDNQIISNIVEEDVGFGPENLGIATEDIWKRVEEALYMVNMTRYRHMSPNRLSGGQKQRVAIAGVLAMRPKCIVLDEPTAMLDPVGRKEVIQTIYELNKKEKITIILITHYMEEVVNADKIYVMDNGKISMVGNPLDIFSQVDKLKELRLDVPQATMIAYELRRKGLSIRKGILTVDELIKELILLMK